MINSHSKTILNIHLNVMSSNEIIPLEVLQSFVNILEAKWKPDSLESKEQINKLFTSSLIEVQRKFKISLSKGILNKAYQHYLNQGTMPVHTFFEQMTRAKSVRTLSGVFVVAIAQEGRPEVLANYYAQENPDFAGEIEDLVKNMTLPRNNLPLKLYDTIKGNGCNENCFYCPFQSKRNDSDMDISRSYLSSEGTFKLGLAEDFCAFRQTLRRILTLEKMGHVPDKHEFILLGGTYHSYPKSYRREFINKIFHACNVYHTISTKFKGKYMEQVNDWHKLLPISNKISVQKIEKFWEELRPMKSLQQEQIENEDALCSRIIGIVIETRPDRISRDALAEMREYGVTRIQLGIQHTDNNLLKMLNRNDTAQSAVLALKKSRDNGFKVDGHLMPDLPGTTIEKDEEMFLDVFAGDQLQLDYVKIYICLDVIYTEIRKMKERAIKMMESGEEDELNRRLTLMQNGDFLGLKQIAATEDKEFKDILVWKPHAEYNYENFFQLLLKSLTLVPPWTRINRFQRDFPEASETNSQLGFVSDNMRSNQQQICMDALKEHGLHCFDIRSREISNLVPTNMEDRARLFVRCYRANEGTEFFISVEVPNRDPVCVDDAILLGLCRLRIPDWDVKKLHDPAFKKSPPNYYLDEFREKPCVRIRELHVYGDTNAVNNAQNVNSQHKGVGKFLMAVAEHISQTFGFEKSVVISGVGVRNFYKRLGYAINRDVSSGQYMSKEFCEENRLPLQLFGRTYSPLHLSLCVKHLEIPQKYFGIDNLTSKYNHYITINNYLHIKDAQCVVINAQPENVKTHSFLNYGHFLMIAFIAWLFMFYY